MDISFVVLTWNSADDIKKCLDSIISECQKINIIFTILIVDNGSTDSTPRILEEYQDKFSFVKCTFFKDNKGTTVSRNEALKMVRSEIVCVIDSDTELGSDDLNPMLNCFKSDPSIGLIAPKLILEDGTIQNSVKKFPTIHEKLSKVKKIFGLGKYDTSDFYSEFPFTEITEVDTAISAAWFFPKKILDEVGLLDEKIFYAPEDVDYSLRIWAAGYKIVYYPDYEILHKTQQISHRKPFGKVARSHLKGLLYYYNKHGYWFSRKKLYKKLDINPR